MMSELMHQMIEDLSNNADSGDSEKDEDDDDQPLTATEDSKSP